MKTDFELLQEEVIYQISAENSGLFALLIWQKVAYLPDEIRKIVTYLPDNQGHE